jgi:hypothetical protein
MSVQRLSTWCAMRCRESGFQNFLEVTSEAAAVDQVRKLCGVKSRSEFDSDPEAEQRLYQIIRIPFINFIQDQETA